MNKEPFSGKFINKYITRVETKNTFGWQVRIRQLHEKGRTSKFFSDSLHGGVVGALKEARIYRTKAFLKIPKRIHLTIHSSGPKLKIWGSGIHRGIKKMPSGVYAF